MSLAPGSRIGSYEVSALVGRGGMGDVYQARDTRLQRDVAIKVLPPIFANDPERLARFQREAHVLASLNHPHIAHVYGLEEIPGGGTALVMELVTGPTLADLIAHGHREVESVGSRPKDAHARPARAGGVAGTLDLEDTLRIGIQIAEALEVAHERGIIHRDLKPANVKITSDGQVKVLDFGLAKALDAVASGAHSQVDSPTITSPAMTEAGMILGTAAYMSPEQARGRSVDRRADIWAFGCVLFEMCAGRPPFPDAETVSDTLASILKEDPQWALLPPAVPPAVRSIIERCLRKDVRRRLPDIAAARIELEDARNVPVAPTPAAAPPARRAGWLWPVVAAVLAFAAAASLFPWRARTPDADTRATRFRVAPPANVVTFDVAHPIAPDGRTIAFVATANGVRRIWVRPLGAFETTPLAGTELATRPFWSADSRFIAFFADGKLKKIPAAGGAPLVIAETAGRDGAWSSRDVILVGMPGGPLQRISASGGQLTPASALGPGEVTHDYPDFLPDGRHFFYLARRGPEVDDWDVYVGDLDSDARVLLPGVHAGPKYAPGGHIVYLRDDTLVAQPFDPERLALAGDAVPLSDRVVGRGGPRPFFTTSSNGTLAYQGAPTDLETALAWFDRSGKQQSVVGPIAEYGRVRLSPDGKLAAFERANDIFVLDTETGSTSRVVSTPAADVAPVWSPDGQRIAFASSRDPVGYFSSTNANAGQLYERRVGAVGPETLLLKTNGGKIPYDWSRDGRYLAYIEGNDVWALPLGSPSPAAPIRVTETSFVETNPQFSPDVHWIAYQSNESGPQPEVWVQAFPGLGRKRQISAGGGALPRWKPGTSELLYVTPDYRLMSVTLSSSSTSGVAVEMSKAVQLFQSLLLQGSQPYDVTADGRLLLNIGGRDSSPPISVVLNWASELKK